MIKLYTGDVLKCLAKLPDESVQCVVTSPPYWGLRDYGTATWKGGDPDCEHEVIPGPVTEKYKVCKCGARRIDDQLGLEPTPAEFVANMVRVFAEVRRVLRPNGVCWVNLGDSYSNIGKSGGETSGKHARSLHGRHQTSSEAHGGKIPGLKPKDLVGIPWRVAFALQADGWYLRSDVVWHKPNPMPESVRDRPTKSHEYVFLLTKRSRYYYDADAVREPVSGDPRDRLWGKGSPTSFTNHAADLAEGMQQKRPAGFVRMSHPLGKNSRSVWTITPKPFKGAHFATFPPALVERCVKAGTSEAGCCPECSAPWERVVEVHYSKSPIHGPGSVVGRHYETGQNNFDGSGMPRLNKNVSTLGWRPTCSCGTERPLSQEKLEADPSLLDGFEIEPFPPVPCTVLDPFSGAGTVALVAQQLGRDAIGIDLNPKYNAMARKRIAASSHPAPRTPHSALSA